MIDSVILWTVAIFLFIAAALTLEVVGEEIAKGRLIQARTGRITAAVFTAFAVANIVLAVQP